MNLEAPDLSQNPTAGRNWVRTALLLLAAISLSLCPQAFAADCPGDIGCLACRGRYFPRLGETLFMCALEDHNGGCACLVYPIPGGEACNTYGECIYTGWQGGDPPRV